MKIIKKIILPSCLILFFVGCGSEEGDSDESICESSCVGSVMQVDFDNKEAVIALGEAGSEYIIMPFSLGSKASWVVATRLMKRLISLCPLVLPFQIRFEYVWMKKNRII